MQAQPSSTLQQLRALLAVGKLLRDEQELDSLFDRVAATISDALGFATVSINVHRPAWDDYEVVTVHGPDAARATLLGNTTDRESWQPYLSDRFRRRGAYFVAYEEIDWEDPTTFYVPDLEPRDDPDAWHPEDLLVVPLERSDGRELGFISVDEPVSGRRPDDDAIDLLVALAAHVAAAIESAQNAFLAERHREALAQLLEISSQLAAAESVDAVLAAVARGISSALGFEKVVVALPDESGRFIPRGTAGWAADDPGLDFFLTHEDMARLLDPAFATEGCTLVEREEAEARVGARGSSYRSERNGRGSSGWNRHWLIVPLVVPDGSLVGFIWADDPEDRLLPSPERLQALRTFANQATMALRAAEDFETLNARNRELAALHETAVGMLERVGLDRVLAAIVESARRLVDAPNAYLYLADPQSGALRMRVGLGEFERHVGHDVLPGRGVSGRVVLSGETVAVEDYRRWDGRVRDYDESELRAVIGVPLRAGGELAGVIGIARQDARPFSPAQVALLERFGGLASLALENAHLYAALEQSETLHRGIVEASTDMICLVGVDARIEMISPSVERVLGVAPDELAGLPFAEFVHRDDLEDARANFERALVGPASMTVRAQHADGRFVTLEATATPVVGADGKTERVLATLRDVTERQLLEEQLRQAQKMESIGRLAGGVAHDFNNILTAIRGYAELLLLDLADDAPARESAAEIARAATRAASLTGQLLAFSRKQVLRPQRLDLNEIVSGMSSMLARMLGEDVVLTTALETELRPTVADPTQLEQVVLNLAVNARDAMPRGGRLTIRTANADLDDGPHVALVVADTGTGMDTGTAERIFEPFFTTKEVGAGTGLGLATVHGIVVQTGGSIEVTSEPGIGTTFTVCLPVAL